MRKSRSSVQQIALVLRRAKPGTETRSRLTSNNASSTAIGPWSPIQTQISHYFPPTYHPYRIFERAILRQVTPQSAVLDVGCGRAAPALSMLKGKAGKLNGIDLVEFTNEDPELLLYKQNVEAMPAIATASIDVAYSRSVMEHVQDTEAALRRYTVSYVPEAITFS